MGVNPYFIIWKWFKVVTKWLVDLAWPLTVLGRFLQFLTTFTSRNIKLCPATPVLLYRSTFGTVRYLVEPGMAIVTLDDRDVGRDVREDRQRLRLLSVFDAAVPRYAESN